MSGRENPVFQDDCSWSGKYLLRQNAGDGLSTEQVVAHMTDTCCSYLMLGFLHDMLLHFLFAL